MRARHVWFAFAFVLGIACFAEVASEHGVIWGWYTVTVALFAAAKATALVLACLAIVLSAESD